jgi:hypothetical protein
VLQRQDSGSDKLLTKLERLEKMDMAYYTLISESTECNKAGSANQSTNNAAAGGSVAGGSSTGGSNADGGQATASSNRLSENETSTASSDVMGSEKPQQAPSDTVIINSNTVSSPAGDGRKHKTLKGVDNKAVLRAQIKAQADIESDPLIKERLMKEYEILK